MARIGSFDVHLLPLAWFDETTTTNGWFDNELIEAAAAGGGVDSTSSSSQAQSQTATLGLSISCSVSSSQAESTTVAADRSVAFTVGSGESQSVLAELSLPAAVDCTVTSSQGQSAEGNYTRNISATVSSDTVQIAEATFLRLLDTLGVGGQSQSSISTLDLVGYTNCYSTSSQTQSTLGECVVEQIRRGGGVSKRKTPKWLDKLIKDLEGDQEWVEEIVDEVKSKPVEVLEKVVTDLPYFDLDTKQIYLAIELINKEIKRKKAVIKKQNEEILMFLL